MPLCAIMSFLYSVLLRKEKKSEERTRTNEQQKVVLKFEQQCTSITWKPNKEYVYSGFKWMKEHPTNIKDYAAHIKSQ